MSKQLIADAKANYCLLCEQFSAWIVGMDPKEMRDSLRAYLNSDGISLVEVERETKLSRSWLSKFRRGELDNPTIDHLAALHSYRESRVS